MPQLTTPSRLTQQMNFASAAAAGRSSVLLFVNLLLRLRRLIPRGQKLPIDSPLLLLLPEPRDQQRQQQWLLRRLLLRQRPQQQQQQHIQRQQTIFHGSERERDGLWPCAEGAPDDVGFEFLSSGSNFGLLLWRRHISIQL